MVVEVIRNAVFIMINGGVRIALESRSRRKQPTQDYQTASFRQNYQKLAWNYSGWGEPAVGNRYCEHRP